MNKYTKEDLEKFISVCPVENKGITNSLYLGDDYSPFQVTTMNIIPLFRTLMATIQNTVCALSFNIITHPYILTQVKISDTLKDERYKRLFGDYVCSLNYFFTGNLYYNSSVPIISVETSPSGKIVYPVICVSDKDNIQPQDISIAMVCR
jgi:hypothetical protein